VRGVLMHAPDTPPPTHTHACTYVRTQSHSYLVQW
jgi:hypothetical protein